MVFMILITLRFARVAVMGAEYPNLPGKG